MNSSSHPTFLDTHSAASFLRLSVPTLKLLRRRGEGPAFCRVGRRVIYSTDDLVAFMESRKVRVTQNHLLEAVTA